MNKKLDFQHIVHRPANQPIRPNSPPLRKKHAQPCPQIVYTQKGGTFSIIYALQLFTPLNNLPKINKKIAFFSFEILMIWLSKSDCSKWLKSCQLCQRHFLSHFRLWRCILGLSWACPEDFLKEKMSHWPRLITNSKFKYNRLIIFCYRPQIAVCQPPNKGYEASLLIKPRRDEVC